MHQYRPIYKNSYIYIYIYINVWRDATQSSLFIILQVHSICFGCQPHSSSGVHKTVTTVSGTGHIFVQLPNSNVANLVTLDHTGDCITVLCTDDGCGWYSKHVAWTCRIINRLLCVASRRTIVNISFVIYFPLLFKEIVENKLVLWLWIFWNCFYVFWSLTAVTTWLNKNNERSQCCWLVVTTWC